MNRPDQHREPDDPALEAERAQRGEPRHDRERIQHHVGRVERTVVTAPHDVIEQHRDIPHGQVLAAEHHARVGRGVEPDRRERAELPAREERVVLDQPRIVIVDEPALHRGAVEPEDHDHREHDTGEPRISPPPGPTWLGGSVAHRTSIIARRATNPGHTRVVWMG